MLVLTGCDVDNFVAEHGPVEGAGSRAPTADAQVWDE